MDTFEYLLALVDTLKFKEISLTFEQADREFLGCLVARAMDIFVLRFFHEKIVIMTTFHGKIKSTLIKMRS